MSEIPDDIMKSAHAVYDAALSDGFRSGSIKIIAKAILSERQRQTEVMEEVRKEARRQALEEAAILVEAHPMRFAGQNENYVRRSMAEAVRALLSRLEER